MIQTFNNNQQQLALEQPQQQDAEFRPFQHRKPSPRDKAKKGRKRRKKSTKKSTTTNTSRLKPPPNYPPKPKKRKRQTLKDLWKAQKKIKPPPPPIVPKVFLMDMGKKQKKHPTVEDQFEDATEIIRPYRTTSVYEVPKKSISVSIKQKQTTTKKNDTIQTINYQLLLEKQADERRRELVRVTTSRLKQQLFSPAFEPKEVIVIDDDDDTEEPLSRLEEFGTSLSHSNTTTTTKQPLLEGGGIYDDAEVSNDHFRSSKTSSHKRPSTLTASAKDYPPTKPVTASIPAPSSPPPTQKIPVSYYVPTPPTPPSKKAAAKKVAASIPAPSSPPPTQKIPVSYYVPTPPTPPSKKAAAKKVAAFIRAPSSPPLTQRMSIYSPSARTTISVPVPNALKATAEWTPAFADTMIQNNLTRGVVEGIPQLQQVQQPQQDQLSSDNKSRYEAYLPPVAWEEIKNVPKMPPVPPDTNRKNPVTTHYIGQYDVLHGRGGLTNSNPGNTKLRKLVHKFRLAYFAAPKGVKRSLAKAILNYVRSKKGRFLDREEKFSTKWYEVGDEKATWKVSQLLRDGMQEMENLSPKDVRISDL